MAYLSNYTSSLPGKQLALESSPWESEISRKTESLRDHVLSVWVSSFHLLNHVTDFHKIWYEVTRGLNKHAQQNLTGPVEVVPLTLLGYHVWGFPWFFFSVLMPVPEYRWSWVTAGFHPSCSLSAKKIRPTPESQRPSANAVTCLIYSIYRCPGKQSFPAKALNVRLEFLLLAAAVLRTPVRPNTSEHSVKTPNALP